MAAYSDQQSEALIKTLIHQAGSDFRRKERRISFHEFLTLDQPAKDDQGATIRDLMPDNRVQVEPNVIDRVRLGRLFRVLTRKQRRVLYLLYAEDLTESEIAGMMGISQKNVSRLKYRALTRLQEAICDGK